MGLPDAGEEDIHFGEKAKRSQTVVRKKPVDNLATHDPDSVQQ
jgi:hypothetical protein